MSTTETAAEPTKDYRVLEVQEWLNSTYGTRVGFDIVPETGKTGWSTMYGLTKALQVELGISALSTNFGAGTLSALATQYGNIGSTSKGTNLSRIVRIIQGALYCKGYNPNGIDGIYGNGCTTAVNKIKTDMGFPVTSPGTVTPKVFKALLTMDAYVTLPGGSANARAVQQWLNQEYLDRQNFFIMPCDGLYSRNVQKNLVYAIQYSIGMDDATANGNFGPGTRDGITSKGQFGIGASDGTNRFVRLFHAAMIFNQFSIPFDATFSGTDSAIVAAFQKFCKLDETSMADYRTWCSLLVSNGDPTRQGTACDTRVQITPALATRLSKAGYKTVGRYLTNARTASALDKEIKPGELEAIFAASLTCFPIFQEIGSNASNFSYVAGLNAAYRADQAARRLGIPAGTTIYFAVDFDATDDEVNSSIIPHFKGIAQALRTQHGRYQAAAYGTRNVCQTLSDAGLSANSFVAGMSTGYSGNLGYRLPTNWAFDQIFEHKDMPDLPLDTNIQSGRDVGFDHVTPAQVLPNSDLLDFLTWLEVKAHTYITETEREYRSAAALVCQFMRRNTYSGSSWDMVAGTIDSDWISFAESKVKESGIVEIVAYLDGSQQGLSTPQVFDCAHLFVGIETYLMNGLPSDNNSAVSSDLASWAGDLLSVLNGYKASVALTVPFEGSFDQFVERSVGKFTDSESIVNSFSFTDLCQDADAYNIAHAFVNESPLSFADLTLEHINNSGPSGSTNRFSSFIEWRFGSITNMRHAAREGLAIGDGMPSIDLMYPVLSAALLASGHPPTAIGLFSSDDRVALADAFVDRVIELS
jgi:peptidoglycan hydrolase-like protein with peptidoglycan-binding domain